MLGFALVYFSSLPYLLYNVSPYIRNFVIELRPGVMKEKIFFQNSKGDRLCGILSDPTGDRHLPIVVLCHGFTTNKGGRTYVRLEEIFNQRNYSTFRFDFFGHGESQGKLEEITVSEAVDDVKRAVRFVKDLGYKEIGLIGSSFGGLASIITAGQSEDIFVLALKSPVSDYMGLLIARDQDLDIKTWKEKGFIAVKSAEGQSLKLNYSFFEDAQRLDGYQFAKNIKVPTLLVHGDSDETVPLEQSRKAASLIPDGCLKVIEGADHVYSNPKHFEKMLDLISRFIFEISSSIK
jgi:dipeptidyl aminopeptidase/acylaminoacyl peptidase